MEILDMFWIRVSVQILVLWSGIHPGEREVQKDQWKLMFEIVCLKARHASKIWNR